MIDVAGMVAAGQETTSNPHLVFSSASPVINDNSYPLQVRSRSRPCGPNSVIRWRKLVHGLEGHSAGFRA